MKKLLCLSMLVASALLVQMAAAVVPAGAAVTHPYLRSFGSFTSPQSLAVDQATGDVYVLDAGTSTGSAPQLVARFDADGNPSPFAAVGSNVLDGGNTVYGHFSFGVGATAQVAVDHSGGVTDGTVYIASSTDGIVYQYDRSGMLLGRLEGTGTPYGGFATLSGVAVSPTGTLYVAGHAYMRLTRLVPAGSGPITDPDYDAQITDLQPGNLAAGSAGDVYAVSAPDYLNALVPSALTKYAPSAFGQSAPAGTVIDPSVLSVAVNPSNDDVYADNGTKISRYDATGASLGTVGANRFAKSAGVAINGTSGRLYASDIATGKVSMFGPLTTMPDVTTGAATALEPTTATVAGTVNAQGVAGTYQVEYGTTTSYGSTIPQAPNAPGSTDTPVTAQLTGLKPETTYHYRIVGRADGVAGTVVGADRTFTTGGPVLVNQAPTEVTTSSATFHGTVDMRGLPGGEYRFYVAARNTPYSGATAPMPVPAGAGPVSIAGTLSGLPEGAALSVRIGVVSPGTQDFGDAVDFQTVAAPTTLPPPMRLSEDPYGCHVPRLHPLARAVRPGDRVSLAGDDLGVFATVQLGAGPVTPSGYSASGFTVAVPADATGTLPLTINCGTQSNTIGVVVATPPSNRAGVKSKVKGTGATLSIRVPGPGTLKVAGAELTTRAAAVKTKGTTKVKISLTARGKAALRRAKAKRLRRTATVTFTPAGGRAGTTKVTLTFTRSSTR
jgi:hypothetical protein